MQVSDNSMRILAEKVLTAIVKDARDSKRGTYLPVEVSHALDQAQAILVDHHVVTQEEVNGARNGLLPWPCIG